MVPLSATSSEKFEIENPIFILFYFVNIVRFGKLVYLLLLLLCKFVGEFGILDFKNLKNK